jgi:PAS domain S-box-containing protein
MVMQGSAQPLQPQAGKHDGDLTRANEELQKKTRDLHQAQVTLSRLNRTLLIISECSQALVRAEEEAVLLQDVCRIIVEFGEYRLAWVGFREHDEAKTVKPMAHFGNGAGFLENLRISWADGDLGRGPTGTAIRTGKPIISKNLLTDPNFAPWRPGLAKLGLASGIALPLIASGQTLGALNIFAAEAARLDAEEVIFLMQLANDLAYGIVALRTQAEHRRMEDELILKASLLDLATDAIYVTDFDGNFIYVNEATCQSRGYSRQELLGLNLRQLTPAEYTQNRPQRLEELLAGGETIFETAGLRKDGSTLPLEVHARMIELQDRKVILSVSRDITERKRAEEMNARMEAQMRQVQKIEALGTFAGGIAHEFNNVLGAIKGYIELACMTLESVPNAEKITSKLEAALRGGERAGALVKQILAFSRHNEQQAQPVEILPIIKESLKLLRASIPSTIEIRQHLALNSGVVLADPVQLSQILMNLSSNAYHAMRERGGVLEINLEPLRISAGQPEIAADLKPGAYVRLTVSDTGHGMDKETLGRIFEPFFTTKAVGEGTGLGLSAIHGIVKNLGGAIQAASELGRGSTFQIYFPSYQGAASTAATIDEHIPLGTEHILLVDDEASIVQIGQEFLQRLGYRVTGLTSSTKAWEDFQTRPAGFDLVITDLTMPSMTGIDLAEAMLGLRPDLPVILTTGYSELNIKDKASEMGIRQCLRKPLVLRHLGRAVRRELDSRV